MINKPAPIFLGMAASAAIATSFPAHAKLADSFVLEEVVVTAQRRSQKLQEVPMAVSAFNEQSLQDSGISYVTDVMAYTPGLTGARQGAGLTQFAIRGISSNSFGIGGDNSVGVFVDDAYAGRTTIAGLPFIDIERVEVLKGPQGTLFGRNTSAGAISITSNKPNNDSSLSVTQTLADFGTRKTVATFNLPLIEDKLMIRGTGVYEESDGFVENPVLDRGFGNQVAAAKLSLLYLPTDTVEVLLSINGQSIGEDGRTFEPLDANSPYLGLGGAPRGDLYDDKVHHGSYSGDITDVLGANLRVVWDINDNITLTSISSSLEYANTARFDADGTPLQVVDSIWPKEESESVGQEFRLNGSHADLTWMMGASYFHEQIMGEQITAYDETAWLSILNGLGLLNPVIPANGLGVPHPAFTLCDGSGVDLSILGLSCGERAESDTSYGDFTSKALYGDVTYPVGDSINVSAGLRYSRDTKRWRYQSELSGGLYTALGIPNLILTDITAGEKESQADTWSKLTSRLTIDYQRSDDLMLYASVAQGFKAGGFSAKRAFKDEETWSYEIGFKSTLLNGRAQLNAAAYYYDYDNLQVQVIKNGITRIENVSEMVGKGLEAELVVRPVANLDIISTVSLNQSEIGDHLTDLGSLKGNAPSYSPERSASLVVKYTLDQFAFADLLIQGEANYQSEQFFSIYNTNAESQAGYTLINGRLSLVDKDERWEVSLFGKNLTNKDYLVNVYSLAEEVAQRGMPRYLGVEMRVNFE